MAGRRTFRILTSSQQSGIQSERQHCTHSTANTHKMTTVHTRQLQQYTRPTNNNYTQDNLKLATIRYVLNSQDNIYLLSMAEYFREFGSSRI